MIAGGIMFALLGKDPVEAIRTIFWDPLFTRSSPAYLAAAAAGQGGAADPDRHRACRSGSAPGIWNIGAEGQYIMGAIFGAGVGLAFYPDRQLVDLSA